MGEPKKPSLLGLYYTVPEVAEKLGWSETTIRRHLVPITEWVRNSGQVPFRRFGQTPKVPRWWLQSVIDDAFGPPQDGAEEER